MECFFYLWVLGEISATVQVSICFLGSGGGRDPLCFREEPKLSLEFDPLCFREEPKLSLEFTSGWVGVSCACKLSPVPFLDAPAVTEQDSFQPAGDAMVPLCWCCPPAPAPAMSRTAAPSYHFKSFCGEFERVESALERLEASGFYWGSLSGTEAKELLTSQPPGVFLVRDSSDHHHLFTLSVRTNTGITNLRIQQQGSAFHLEALPGAGHPPAFRCVVQLVEHYLRLGAVEGGPCYLEKEGQPPVPLALTHPLCCKVPALQELCRRAVRASVQGRGDTRAQLQDLPVPRGLLNSLCS